ncbi:MAG: Rrf2 family transcriptional regulator [Lachnospiraceae bacterium]|jgi:Rrf2 family protein|nr:Rrf2 family transcriptional regulator [Lachnospiraceae bacterium]
MKISTRGRYALRVMIDLAEHNDGEYIPLKDIAKRQEISEKYMEKILPILTKAGFLDGLKGKGGGYRLKKAPKEYTVASVLKLVEGSFAPVSCLETPVNTCSRRETCRTLPMWEKLYENLTEFFEGITIEDLCQNPEIIS